MKKKEEAPIGFRLVRIKTEQFAMFPEIYDPKNEQIGMSLGLRFGIDSTKRIIAVLFLVQYEQEKSPFLVLEISNHYQIETKGWKNLEKTEEGIIIPKNLATHLVMLTVGTLRGALHCKVEGTEFNQFILPTIDVTQMVTEDVVLN